MYYLSLDKPPRVVSDWEKHRASLVSWFEFCLFWLLGWLTAWTAASCLFALDGTATLRRSVCLNPLLYACTQQPPWCCGCWIELYGSVGVFFSPALLLLTDDWQTKIRKNNKRPGGLGATELAPLLSVVLRPWPSASWFSLGKPRALSGWKGYI